MIKKFIAKKSFIQYPQTIVFKMRNVAKSKYQVLIFGPFGSIVANLSVSYMSEIGQNLLCMLDAPSCDRLRSESHSESLKLYKLFFLLHRSYWTTLRIIGLGYKVLKAQDKPNELILKIGFSHQIICKVPHGVIAYARKRVVKLWSHSYDLLRTFSYKLMTIKHQKDSFRASGLVPANIKIRLKVGKVSRA